VVYVIITERMYTLWLVKLQIKLCEMRSEVFIEVEIYNVVL